MALVALWTTSIGRGSRTNKSCEFCFANPCHNTFGICFWGSLCISVSSGLLGNPCVIYSFDSCLHSRGGDSSSAPPAPNLSGFGWGHQMPKKTQGVVYHHAMSPIELQCLLHCSWGWPGVPPPERVNLVDGREVTAQVHSNSPKQVAGNDATISLRLEADKEVNHPSTYQR